jgi:hypothetical protein
MLKLHTKSLIEDNSHEHVTTLETLEDFEAIIEKYPSLDESLLRHNDLRAIADEMASYLGGHHMSAWVTEE